MIEHLFLDDIRFPIDSFYYTKNNIYIEKKWYIVRNYLEFIRYIQVNDIPKVISFDHDLTNEHYDTLNKTDFISLDEYYTSSNREMTGYDCAKWLKEYCDLHEYPLPKILCHSMNPIGKQNILNLFQ
jgi:hypothetical protein